MFNPDKYRSVTWLKGGRVYPQLDCFGIVNEIRRDLGLPEWPDFAGVTKEGGGLDREARKLMLTLKRCEPCVKGAGVGLLFGFNGYPMFGIRCGCSITSWQVAGMQIQARGLRFCHCREIYPSL
ncbi:nitrite transporter [Klebsiella pneumoniae]|nr:nitrite transporter [Klebsiella pneumoniae]